MDSGKRRHVDDSDRLSDLLECLLLDILSCVGSRLAVQTSTLSRRWRHLWRDVTCVDVDELEFRLAVSPSNRVGFNQRQQQWARFEDFADHVLLPSSSSPLYQHRRLDAFRLHIVSPCLTNTTTDRWVRRGLARSPAVVSIHSPNHSAVHWITPSPSSPSLLSRITKLHLVGVLVTSLGQILDCPALEDLHMERCALCDAFGAMAHPQAARRRPPHQRQHHRRRSHPRRSPSRVPAPRPALRQPWQRRRSRPGGPGAAASVGRRGLDPCHPIGR
ncbi:MEIOTIC F-BOX protein MOF-like [Brachypodium distachyon]|uniref:F-box domain-containing protein n=1 Tax=Brachypodium distachyon TaxID=15368 RepID=A0A0Q3GWF9_BRADI|nr:MEIOTIC F-BOX protein MOF-like [Brachypodium distachyon]KQK14781.2 hypothetical protein BRADI_1g18537v3 [Brachypodium distachyon]|eukprot:XP_024317249.1 MEIOTIC F-BOX protein MOF-like [Brachypodium distachyon]